MTSDKLNVSLHELETEWSVDDMFDAHYVLDAYAEAEVEARARAK